MILLPLEVLIITFIVIPSYSPILLIVIILFMYSSITYGSIENNSPSSNAR